MGILDVTPKEDLMITCKSGLTIRMGVSSISAQGRATQGVKLIRLDDSDAIAAITNLDEHAGNGAPVIENHEIDEQPDATNPEGSESSGDQL